MSLHVPTFGGGIVRLGSPNVQRTDELLEADSLDIGPRGQLVATSDVTDYYALQDLQAAPAAWSKLYGLSKLLGVNTAFIVALGEGKDAGGVLRHIVALLERSGAAIPLPAGRVFVTSGVAPDGNGQWITTDSSPMGSQPGALIITPGFIYCLLCIGAREGSYPRSAPGLWVLSYDQNTGTTGFNPISAFGASLGNGATAKQLHFRGIAQYNNHVFGYGFDQGDATNGDAPRRVMFSNQGVALAWGKDDQGGGAGRAFTDSDAIVLGDAGEIIRGALAWNGKLWFGTNTMLHYIAGYGRDTYLADGSNYVAKSHNIVGPHAIIEGPDKLMYGVADQGLWAFDGSTFEPHWRRLVDFHGHSAGFWDLIWTDPTAALGVPGRTNQDFVWLRTDFDREQVIVGIPFCNATLGYGAGNDTVLIKFHTRTGGFTRQVLVGVNYTAASYERRLAQQRETRILGTHTTAQTIRRFGYQATPVSSPVMPVALPRAKFGPYLPFGPDGEGVLRRAYLTLAWEAIASLPLVFTVAIAADESTTETFTLTVGAVAPVGAAANDMWLDTSQTDANLGNATAGVGGVAALGGYLIKVYRSAAWAILPGMGDAGARVRIPMPLARRKAARTTIAVTCTAAAGRFQLEGLGINPGDGEESA